MRFGMFLLAEYAHLITSSAFLMLLFFGGYHLPFIPWLSPDATGIGAVLLKIFVFFGKVFLSISLMMLVRWTIPRVRWDQVMKLAWNSLIPLSIALIVLTAVMVFMEWTAWWQMLAMNAVVLAVVVAIQPLLPSSIDRNRRVQMAGSRFCPLPGESVKTTPIGAARDESGVAKGSRGVVSMS